MPPVELADWLSCTVKAAIRHIGRLEIVWNSPRCIRQHHTGSFNEIHLFICGIFDAEAPSFASEIGNATVPVGRDATLSCVIYNLANFKVRSFHFIIIINFFFLSDIVFIIIWFILWGDFVEAFLTRWFYFISYFIFCSFFLRFFDGWIPFRLMASNEKVLEDFGESFAVISPDVTSQM